MSNKPMLMGTTQLEIQQQLLKLWKQIQFLSRGGPVFVFQPGGTAKDNVYTDFSKLVNDASNLKGMKTVYFDDTFAQCDIPSGQWDLGGYTIFHGRQPSIKELTVLNFLDGARISGVYEFHFLDMFSNSSVNEAEHIVMHQAPNEHNSVYILANGSRLKNNGLAPFFIIDLGLVTATWMIMDNSVLVTGIGEPPVESLLAASRNTILQVLAFDSSQVQEYTLGNLPNATTDLRIVNSAAFISENQLVSGSPITADITLSELSSREYYDTANAGNWKTSPPVNVTEALDRIATLLAGEYGPI